MDGGTTSISEAISNSQAAFTQTFSTAGAHTVTAAYQGDANNLPIWNKYPDSQNSTWNPFDFRDSHSTEERFVYCFPIRCCVCKTTVEIKGCVKYMRKSCCTASKRLKVAFCEEPCRDTTYEVVGSATTCLRLTTTFGQRAGFGFIINNCFNARPPLGAAFSFVDQAHDSNC